jgi:predicted ATPase/class 3 adenylate cyclase
MTELPTGTVTFLFTDLESSTRLWEEHPDAMQGALARHDEILRDAIAAHNGHIVKMTGDGAHAAFTNAEEAVAAAVDAQRGLAAESWGAPRELRVRMGIHTGPAEARDGDYFGTAVNRAARLMSAANGGQIVVSLATGELVRDVLRDDVRLNDLGEHRLRDLSRAERVFEITAPGLADDFAPLRSLDAYATNLPIQLSSFVGRQADLIAVQKALTQSRVVTLTGVGGSGKTRLSIQAAAELLPEFPDGAWLCELAAAPDADVLAQIVAAALGVSQRPGTTLEGSILGFLRNRTLLLALDNCEHLLDATGRLVEAVLHGCPDVRILTTSREGLAVDGERVLPLRSLPIPAPTADILDIAASDAVRLFAERAEAARPGFTVDATNAPAVAEICRRLDGMPLAIELAAARVASMRPVEIAALLDERFRLLTGGRRTAVERHQTLRATVDWSYSLLDERDRIVFDRLGVFAGSFDTAGATGVITADDVERWDVLDAIASLVAKSMLVDEEASDGTTRYSMLETLRQYARERLDERGEGDIWRRRHAHYCATLASEIGAELRGPDELAWRERLWAELDSLRAAVTWAFDATDPDDVNCGLRIVAGLAPEVIQDRATGIWAWADAASSRVGIATPGVRSDVLVAAAFSAFSLGDPDATVAYARDAIRDGLPPDVEHPSWVFVALGAGLTMQGRADLAIEANAEGLRALEQLGGDPYGYANLVIAAMWWEPAGRDLAAAQDRSRQALRVARDLGNPSLLTTALSAFAQVWWQDDPDASLAALDETIELMRSGTGRGVFASSLALAARIRVEHDPAWALGALREAYVYSKSVGDQASIGNASDHAVHIFSVLGLTRAAAVLLGAIEGPHAPLSSASAWEAEDRAQVSSQLRSTLGDVEYEVAIADGAAMGYDDIIDFALETIDGLLAELLAEAGRD